MYMLTSCAIGKTKVIFPEKVCAIVKWLASEQAPMPEAVQGAVA